MWRSYRGQPIDFFDRKVPLTSNNGVENSNRPTSDTVSIGQRSNWGEGQPEAEWRGVRWSLTFHFQKITRQVSTTFLTGLINKGKFWPPITPYVKVVQGSSPLTFLIGRYLWHPKISIGTKNDQLFVVTPFSPKISIFFLIWPLTYWPWGQM